MSIDSNLLRFIVSQKKVKKVHIPADILVTNKGDYCDDVIIVLKGQVKVFQPAKNGKTITLYYIEENDSCILTASCVFNQSSFPAFAKTTSEVTALLVPSNVAIKWMKTEPLWQNFILDLLSQRMMNLLELVSSITFESLESRLADWLVATMNHQSSDTIRITHQKIASELASSREVISRLLKKFESAGALSIHRGEIKVINADKLLSISHVMCD